MLKNFNAEIVFVYLQPFRRSFILECAPQLKIAKLTFTNLPILNKIVLQGR